MRRVKSLFIATFLCAVFFLPGHALGDHRLTASLPQLEALYVQRLVNYVRWPGNSGPQPGQSYIVAATDSAVLRPFFPKESGFKLVQWPSSECHILLINRTPDREAAAILKRAKGYPVLTIGTRPINLHQGAMINFYMQSGKLRMQVNPQAADEAGLSISSRLLKLVKIYREKSDE
ncbi:YfiR family protein [Pseudodesulfovibrio piezophilus]|uniref:Transmembrane protein n=1 Tax=Pseudodesulfovibrio piezophilus (strain DSM 21447 / JCM 15486 / C1TLV30) TaxID=1322246 RepID=M1WTE8_PSEP2|nr:YfiR family protein [Pseudodesulfovibrio piezophilus]CCH49507.1 conserved exported protein of unknown function [Pseudodesulfovibrio piezophilus C1TLV30]